MSDFISSRIRKKYRRLTHITVDEPRENRIYTKEIVLSITQPNTLSENLSSGPEALHTERSG